MSQEIDDKIERVVAKIDRFRLKHAKLTDQIAAKEARCKLPQLREKVEIHAGKLAHAEWQLQRLQQKKSKQAIS